MNRNIVFCFFFLLYSCSYQSTSLDCKIPLGKLMLSTASVEWGDVQLGKSYVHTIRIFNPTKNKAVIKIINSNTEFQVMKTENGAISLADESFCIQAFHHDSIKIIFSPIDTSIIGELNKNIHLEVNGELLIAPVKQNATVYESFEDSLNDKKIPIIKIEKDTFNFGTISWKDNPVASFLIKNVGKQNLIIRKVEKKCGCTNVELKDRIILPNRTTILNVTFNPIGKNGKQSTQIRIFSNTPKQPVTVFTLIGYVNK